MSQISAAVAADMLAVYVADGCALRLCEAYVDGGTLLEALDAEIPHSGGYQSLWVPSWAWTTASPANPVVVATSEELTIGPNSGDVAWPLVNSVAITYGGPGFDERLAVWIPTNEISVIPGWTMVVEVGALSISATSEDAPA